MGRKQPSLLGTGVRIRERTAMYTAERANDGVQLMAPLTCADEPVKSKRTRSPRISTRTFTGTSTAWRPSWSS